MPHIPGKDEFLAGAAAYDGNNHVYFEALSGLQSGWGDPTKMADAIWPLLKDWNKPFYRWGKGDPVLLAAGIEHNLGLLNGFRHRKGPQKRCICSAHISWPRGTKQFQIITAATGTPLAILSSAEY